MESASKIEICTQTYDRGTGAQQFRGLVMGEIHRKPSEKSGTRRENRSVPDFPDLSPSFSDNRGYLRFLVFISRQNLGQLGNRKISSRLVFSRHENQAHLIETLDPHGKVSRGESYLKVSGMLVVSLRGVNRRVLAHLYVLRVFGRENHYICPFRYRLWMYLKKITNNAVML